jgi:hypothetical protein
MRAGDKDRGRDSAKRHPSLQTGRADFPHPAFQSVGTLSRGSGSSPRPQGCQPDFRYLSSHMRLMGSTVGEPLRALSLVCCPVFRLSSFHLPTSLRSTVVTRFVATTNALTPGGRLFGPLGHELRLTPSGLPDYLSKASHHSVSNHLRVVRGSPGCQQVFFLP